MPDEIKDAQKLLYQAQLKLSQLLEQKPPYPVNIEHWCRVLQNLMDEMNYIVSYSPFGKDPRTTQLTEQDAELLKKK